MCLRASVCPWQVYDRVDPVQASLWYCRAEGWTGRSVLPGCESALQRETRDQAKVLDAAWVPSSSPPLPQLTFPKHLLPVVSFPVNGPFSQVGGIIAPRHGPCRGASTGLPTVTASVHEDLYGWQPQPNPPSPEAASEIPEASWLIPLHRDHWTPGIVPGFLSSSKSLCLPAVVASMEAKGGANLV